MRLIPAIDLKEGKCVRLYKGDFEQTTEYSSDPVAVARRFSQLNVADLHVVDLDGARTGQQSNFEIVAEITRETDLAVQLGGGIRRRDDVARWLSSGVSRCVVGSTAIENPDEVRGWLEEFGTDRIVLALDVRIQDGTPLLTTRGWTQDAGLSLWQCIDAYTDAGLRHVLCTDVSRDGAMAGPNVALYADVLERYPSLELQASGGIRNLADLATLREAGLPAAISGKALLDGKISPEEISTFRQNA